MKKRKTVCVPIGRDFTWTSMATNISSSSHTCSRLEPNSLQATQLLCRDPVSINFLFCFTSLASMSQTQLQGPGALGITTVRHWTRGLILFQLCLLPGFESRPSHSFGTRTSAAASETSSWHPRDRVGNFRKWSGARTARAAYYERFVQSRHKGSISKSHFMRCV